MAKSHPKKGTSPGSDNQINRISIFVHCTNKPFFMCLLRAYLYRASALPGMAMAQQRDGPKRNTWQLKDDMNNLGPHIAIPIHQKTTATLFCSSLIYYLSYGGWSHHAPWWNWWNDKGHGHRARRDQRCHRFEWQTCSQRHDSRAVGRGVWVVWIAESQVSKNNKWSFYCSIWLVHIRVA